MLAKMLILAAIVTFTHGGAFNQNMHTKYSNGRNNSILASDSQRQITNLSIRNHEPLQFTSTKSTESTCECKIIKDRGTLFLALVLGFIIGSLGTGTIAGLFVLRMRLKEIKKRHEREDIIMNLIEWNDLRRNARRNVSEMAIQTENTVENEAENTLHLISPSIHDNVENAHDQ